MNAQIKTKISKTINLPVEDKRKERFLSFLFFWYELMQVDVIRVFGRL
jgi:hypothetical protein